jgi:hypothetical protein
MISVDAPSIFGLRTPTVGWTEIQATLRLLDAAMRRGDRQSARTIMKAFCQPGNRLLPIDESADFEAALGRSNGSPLRDIARLSGAANGATNGHADFAGALNGKPAQLPENGRNGLAKQVTERDRIDIPAEAQWRDQPPPSEPKLDEPGTAVALPAERGVARRH